MTVSTQPLVRAAQSRTQRVRDDIQFAMNVIEKEIDEAKGLYPHKGGRLTLAEVCRRANVHPITMMGKAHKDTTRPKVLAWVKQINARIITGSRSVRRTVTQRADNWEAEYKLIAAKYKQMYSIEVVQRDAKLEKLQARVSELEAENLRLHEQVSEGRVVRLQKKKS